MDFNKLQVAGYKNCVKASNKEIATNPKASNHELLL
jgi:hypothetical protein